MKALLFVYQDKLRLHLQGEELLLTLFVGIDNALERSLLKFFSKHADESGGLFIIQIKKRLAFYAKIYI